MHFAWKMVKILTFYLLNVCCYLKGQTTTEARPAIPDDIVLEANDMIGRTNDSSKGNKSVRTLYDTVVVRYLV